jgi:outer membrane protein OmpA-like peptidoglycan-associated protein
MKSPMHVRSARFVFSSGALFLMCVSCSQEPEPKMPAAPHPAPAAPTAEMETTASSTELVVSEPIRRRCDLPDTPPESPQFDYDQADLRPRGTDILASVAKCMLEGPLKDEGVTITGHADPRGSDAYNRDLGMRRATSAQEYLLELGVSTERISTRSLGEREATGTDPASWQVDRRVEIEEMNPQNL